MPKCQWWTANITQNTEAPDRLITNPNHSKVYYSIERPSNTIQEPGIWVTEPCTAEELDVQGSPGHLWAKNDRRPACQKLIVMEDHANTNLPEIVSTEDNTVALCAKKEL